MKKKHPHDGRLAEVYRLKDGLLVFWYYTADRPERDGLTANWETTMQAWVLTDG